MDGLGYGDNTKAAVIRLGLMETVAFCKEFYKSNYTLSVFCLLLALHHKVCV